MLSTDNQDKTMQPKDLYAEVTARIVAALEAGTVPWRKNWEACQGTPRNWDGRPYGGANWIMLGTLPYPQPVFVTFRKALDLGGAVRKGEKGHLVVFWKFLRVPDAKDPTKTKVVPMLRHYHVFNVSQCDGLPPLPEVAKRPFEAIQECQRIVDAMPQAPSIAHDGHGRCFYRPKTDSVHMAARESFLSPADYYHVLFHELGHSTGHSSRLDRDGITECAAYGSPVYSREELVAELTAANLSAHAGIESPSLGENQAAYVAGWIARLKEDSKAIVWAAGKAARAADFILGKHRAEESDTTTTEGAA